jgi:MarR family transcriptional regulator, organic hydroperoxide resistance regulator
VASRAGRPRTTAARQGRAAGLAEDCEPERCPCDDQDYSPSRYARAAAAAAGDGSHGERTLEATEQAVAERLAGLPVDMNAMAAVSNIYRAANEVRNYLERTVLAPHDLTWTGWVVLWVVWIWGEIETRHVAAEAGISKGTLTGVAGTLMSRGLIERRVHPADARRVLLSLSPAGAELMQGLFPQFNREESRVTSQLAGPDVLHLARLLRVVIKQAAAT